MFNKIQYISQGNTIHEQSRNISAALDAGCQWIQLRFKNALSTDLEALAEDIQKSCARYQATFIINDYPYIAKAVDADGVHLGLSDMTVREAFAILGAHKIVGGTANTLEDVKQRTTEGCKYIGLGPLRFTPTKQKLSPFLGLEGYNSILQKLTLKEKAVPVYAIGGVIPEDIPSLLQYGVYGIALSGLITNSRNKIQLMSDLKKYLA